MDQCPPGSAVAVDEGVDSFEVRVSNGCLDDSWQIIGVDECDEVLDKLGDKFRGRRNKGSRAGVVVAPADPVLLCPDAAAVRPGVCRKAAAGGPRAGDPR